jgi:hypothetical protein
MVSSGKKVNTFEYVKLDMDACTEVAHKLVALHDRFDIGRNVPEVEYSKAFLPSLEASIDSLSGPVPVKLPGMQETEEIKTKNPSKDGHLLFLILSSAQDASKQSNVVYKGGMRLLQDYSYQDLVDKLKEDRLEGKTFPYNNMHKIAIKYFGASKYGNPGLILESCLDVLESFGGNPWNLIAEAKTPEDFRKTVRKIHGIGRNISSILLKNCVRFEYHIPEDLCNIPIKIDRHALRISFANGVVTFLKDTTDLEKGIYRAPVERALERAYMEVCKRDRLNPIALDDAKWRLGFEMSRDPNTILRKASGLKFGHKYGHPVFKDGEPNPNYFIHPPLPPPLFSGMDGNGLNGNK